MLKAPLYTCKPSPTRFLNRSFTLAYGIAILALLYRHCFNLLMYSPSLTTISLFVADLVLGFLWVTWQAYFVDPVVRHVFPENLPQVAEESEYPALDVFVLTADPFKEPPVGVLNTALSVLAYDYPSEKLSVYVSDDGGSQLTLFAFMEAAEFAKHWLPYCRKYNIMDRSPEVYFGKGPSLFPETKEIQGMYESMKTTIQQVFERGAMDPTINPFCKWIPGSTRHQHPTIIQVLLKNKMDKDVSGHSMPNLFYLSREKNKAVAHNSKAGALNALIRVSTVITNAPIFLTLDCDMYSNYPKTPLHTLCYFLDPNMDPKLAFVQFPQRFHNINKNDTYGAEYLLETRLCPLGMDGLGGTIFMGTGGFFRRQVLLQYPTEPQQLWNEPFEYKDVLKLAHHVASCSYEENTKWGSEVHFFPSMLAYFNPEIESYSGPHCLYGTLVEDIYTGFRLHCLGWKSLTCSPTRAAFLGNMPIALNDILNQSNRWNMGMLQAGLSKFSPLTFGIKFLNPLHALCYAHYFFRAFWSIPVIIYAFLPQLALINSSPTFPKVSDPWFYLYAFLFVGAYAKDFVDCLTAGSVFKQWWNRQRMWLIMGCSSYPFALSDWLFAYLGMSTFEFNVTNKASNTELSQRYEQGVFELGVESPLLLPVSTAAIVNLFSFLLGITQVMKNNGRLEELFVQLFLSVFGVVNSWPIYEGMVLRTDGGKMPTKMTLKSVCVGLVIYWVFTLAF